ncbi:MAG: hypothetical protein ABJG78_01740 [Cyclobacteriaceae bacterium]
MISGKIKRLTLACKWCITLFVSLFSSCQSPGVNVSDKVDYILAEKDLIPEGTAFNSKTNSVYVGSIYQQKIIEINSEGKVSAPIQKDLFGDFSPIGMEMDTKRDKLWVNVALAPIVNRSGSQEWKTTIMTFDMVNHLLVKEYGVIDEQRAFLNDLTVAANGDVYATETSNGKIYKVDAQTDQLEVYLELVGFSFPNGITYYEPLQCLFVATNEGIIKIELKSKKVSLLETGRGIDAKVIDGLSIFENYFIGHQSSKVSKFYFNENQSKITKSEILDTGEEFDSSTTGEIGNGHYYFIVNSQIKSGIDQKNKSIKPMDSLEEVIVRRMKL